MKSRMEISPSLCGGEALECVGFFLFVFFLFVCFVLMLVFMYNLFSFGVQLTSRAICFHRCFFLYWLLSICPTLQDA